MSKLSLKQSTFIDEYFINGMIGWKAYAKVYKIKDELVATAAASRLLTNVNVDLEIQSRKRKISSKYNLTIQTQIDELNEFIESCVKEGMDGSGIIKDRNNWFKAIAEKNKLAGLIKNKQELTHINPVQIDFNFNDIEDADDNEDKTISES